MDILLFAVYLGVFLVFFNAEIMTSFYPTVAEKERDLQSSLVGIVFSMFPIGWLIGSYISGKYMDKKGARKYFILIGICL